MAMPVIQIIEWLSTLEPDDEVGVGEGGLDLRVNTEESEEYLEIGGMPTEDDDE